MIIILLRSHSLILGHRMDAGLGALPPDWAAHKAGAPLFAWHLEDAGLGCEGWSAAVPQGRAYAALSNVTSRGCRSWELFGAGLVRPEHEALLCAIMSASLRCRSWVRNLVRCFMRSAGPRALRCFIWRHEAAGLEAALSGCILAGLLQSDDLCSALSGRPSRRAPQRRMSGSGTAAHARLTSARQHIVQCPIPRLQVQHTPQPSQVHIIRMGGICTAASQQMFPGRPEVCVCTDTGQQVIAHVRRRNISPPG